MDCLPLHPTSSPRGVEWKLMTFPTFALLLWSWRSRDAGLQMECSWSYCLLRKMMEDVFFFCFDRLQAYCVTLLVNTDYSLTTRFPFFFISYTVMIELFYACVFVPFFYRTLMPLMAVMENETWIQPSNIPHYLLHGDPFASRLSREADIVAALYICIIGQWLIAKKEKSYSYSSPGNKGYINLAQIQCLNRSNSLHLTWKNLK